MNHPALPKQLCVNSRHEAPRLCDGVSLSSSDRQSGTTVASIHLEGVVGRDLARKMATAYNLHDELVAALVNYMQVVRRGQDGNSDPTAVAEAVLAADDHARRVVAKVQQTRVQNVVATA